MVNKVKNTQQVLLFWLSCSFDTVSTDVLKLTSPSKKGRRWKRYKKESHTLINYNSNFLFNSPS